MPDTARHAVFGHPVSHSLSPRLHAAFGTLTGIPLVYDAVDVEVDGFDAALAAFVAAGGTGANVTLPLKTGAAARCATLSERARQVGAVNTLVRRGGAWHGDNTDGAGLVRDLTERQGLDLRGRRTLLLGAGGAARGVAAALMDAGIDSLHVVNRTGAHADALVDMLGQPGRAHARYLDDLPTLGEFQLVVQATSATRGGALPMLPMSLVGLRTACVDLNYGEAAIPFLAWAKTAGAHDTIDGLGMLVEQAAEAFELWHGVRPRTDTVHDRLRAGESLLVTAD